MNRSDHNDDIFPKVKTSLSPVFSGHSQYSIQEDTNSWIENIYIKNPLVSH